MTSESYHLELEIFATHMGGEDGSVSGGTIDVMRPSARVFIELQEDPRVSQSGSTAISGQGVVFGLVSEMDTFDTESLLECQDGNSCLERSPVEWQV